MALYAVDIVPPQILSISRNDNLVEEQIAGMVNEAFINGTARRLVPGIFYDYTPPENFDGKIGVMAHENGGGAVIESKRRGRFERVIKRILRRTDSDYTVTTHTLPEPNKKVYIGEIIPEYGQSDPRQSIPALPSKIGKLKVVRTVVVYQDKDSSIDMPIEDSSKTPLASC